MTAVLHICSDFAKQKLYAELVSHLDDLGVKQSVFVPVRTREEIGVNRRECLSLSNLHYSHVLRPSHRFFFRRKIRTVTRDLLGNVDPSSFTAIHAHFLYSDGAVALALHRQFGLPYVVTVRNTDVNVFMRLRPDLNGICREILARAAHVTFVTPAYRDLVLAWSPARSKAMLAGKMHVIPNGLAQFWLENAYSERRRPHACLKLIYVGDLSRNKNVATTIRAVAIVNEKRSASLTLVGSGGDGESDVDSLLASGRYPFVQRVGRVESPDELLGLYRSHDVFVMPSFRETFGVAYLEALSQGLPVICTKGQGIDGYFEPGSVAEAVDPHDAGAVAGAILSIERRLERIRDECAARAKSFNWQGIARSYAELYSAVGIGPARAVAG